MSTLIMNALIAEANAKEAKAVANLQNYMSNSVGVGEHPDVVAECKKLVMEIADARELRETINEMIENNNKKNQE